MKNGIISAAELVRWLMKKHRRAIFPGNRDRVCLSACLIRSLQDHLDKAERARVEMACFIKDKYRCAQCKHWRISERKADEEPCASCKGSQGYPNWEWRGYGKWKD